VLVLPLLLLPSALALASCQLEPGALQGSAWVQGQSAMGALVPSPLPLPAATDRRSNC
jgi:hypothetical protein